MPPSTRVVSIRRTGLRWCARLAVSAPLSLGAGAHAQSDPPKSEPPRLPPDPEPIDSAPPSTILGEKDVQAFGPDDFAVEISLSYRLGFESDLDGGGEYSVDRAGLTVTPSVALSEKLRLALDLSVEWSNYDFSGATPLFPGPGPTITDAYTYRVSPSIFYSIDETWGVLLGCSFESSLQDGAEFDESIRWGGFGGVRYQWTESFALTLGVNAATRLEDDAIIIPIIGVDWRVNDKVTLRTEGPGAAAVVDLGEGFLFTLRGRWEPREYRLDDSGPVPGGVLRDEAILLGVELGYRPSNTLLLAAEVGGVFDQEFETLNSNGNEVAKEDSDPSLYIGFRASIRF